MNPSPSAAFDTSRKKLLLWTLLAIVSLAAFIAFRAYGTTILETLIRQEQSLRDLRVRHPLLIGGVAMLIYIALTGLSFPGAMLLTMLFGWLFGFIHGLLMVSFASTAGASLSFLISRYFLRDFVVSRFGERLQKMNTAVEKEGAYYLLSLRLLPIAPFFVTNLAMGLTPIRLKTYWWVSQLGTLPGTSIVVYTGTAIPDLATLRERGLTELISPSLIFALALLSIFPLIAKHLQTYLRKDRL